MQCNNAGSDGVCRFLKNLLGLELFLAKQINTRNVIPIQKIPTYENDNNFK